MTDTVCPEHGGLCGGPDCCCADLHTAPAADPDATTTHYQGDHSSHVHQCGCAICLARCEGAAWERLRIRQRFADDHDNHWAQWAAQEIDQMP